MNFGKISRENFCTVLSTSIGEIQKNFGKLEEEYYNDIEKQRKINIVEIDQGNKAREAIQNLCSRNTKELFEDWFNGLLQDDKVKLGCLFNVYPTYGSVQFKYEADNETLKQIQNKYQEVYELNCRLLDEHRKLQHEQWSVTRERIVAIHPKDVEARLQWMLKRVDDSAHGNEGFLSKAEVKAIKMQFKNYPWLESKCRQIDLKNFV